MIYVFKSKGGFWTEYTIVLGMVTVSHDFDSHTIFYVNVNPTEIVADVADGRDFIDLRTFVHL
jgi:hypothetical protein